MTWKLFSKISAAFPNLQELILCKNDMTDTENIKLKEKDLQHLTFLNLEMTQLNTFDGFKDFFGNLPLLHKLILNLNNLTELGKITGFSSIRSVSLEKN